MNLPTLKVTLDNSTGSFPFDITSKVLAVDGYQITRGRDDWQSAVTAGEMTLTLNNSDGRFTPGSTILASPSPIVVDQRIRLQEVVNGVTYTRATTYVKSWPVEWPETVATFAKVRLSGVDAQARGERRPLRSLATEEIMIDSPTAYYTLAEPAGSTSAGDTSGNQAASLAIDTGGAAMAFGATSPVPDGLTAASFAGSEFLSDGGTVLLTAVPSTLSMGCWFSTTTPNVSLLQGQGDLGWELSLNGSGAVRVFVPGAGGGLITGPVVNDGLGHYVIATADGVTARLYVDGVSVGSRAVGAPSGGQQVLNVGRGFTGTIAHVAIYATALSAARIASHAGALTGFAGESGTARIARLAGYAGIPVGTLDPSLTNVAAMSAGDGTVWGAIQEAADAEMGVAYVDGTGAVTFHNRNRVVSKTTPDLTLSSQWITPDVAPVNDDQQLVNYMEVTAEGTGVTQLVRDAASDTSHGRYPGSRSYMVQTDAEALDRANWLVGNLAEPSTRYGTLTINLYGMTPALASSVVNAIDVDCWLRVTSMASQNPGGTTADVIVQGFTETVSADTWTIACNVVSRSPFYAPVAIFGTSVFGANARFYV